MDERAAALAGLIEKSMNLEPEWTVTGVEFREGFSTGDELHVFVERTPGCAVECPSCHRGRVADRFHVMQIANRRLDLVRACEARESDEKRSLLSRTKYVWLKREENLTPRQAERKRSLAAENLKTGRACMMVEALRRIYEACGDAGEARAELDVLTSWIMHSNVPQMKKLARTLRDNGAEVLAYFGNRLTNAILEGMNSVAQSAKRAARGFRNIEYFKTIIYLKLGKLPLVAATCATR